jgi:membrane fusion protein (multidrug efflux system)
MNALPKTSKADPAEGRAAAGEPGSTPEETEGSRRKRRARGRLMIVALPLAFAVVGGYFWLAGGRYISTDNAYVHQPIVPVSADIAGRIVEVDVSENAQIAAGATVFRLDPVPYRIALDQAEAALASARLDVDRMRSAYGTAQARLAAAEEVRDVHQREFERQQELGDRGLMSASAIDTAKLALQAAENDVALARLGVREAAAALGGDPDIATDDFPAVREALARRDVAARDLAMTTVVAPVSGIVSQIGSLNVGQYVTPGTLVASLVQSEETWIEANFKETQIAGVMPGQPVTVEIDAYPGTKFAGSVDSIGSATGAQFALIPAQNATGNWVKVVQRIPVRVHVEADPEHPLLGGMSAYVSVDTGSSRFNGL